MLWSSLAAALDYSSSADCFFFLSETAAATTSLALVLVCLAAVYLADVRVGATATLLVASFDLIWLELEVDDSYDCCCLDLICFFFWSACFVFSGALVIGLATGLDY